MAIDSFSKKGYAVGLKRKTSDLTLASFREILKNIDFKIRNICVDNGSEFQGDFKKWCSKKKINLFTVDGDKKNAVVERFIQTIKTKLGRYYRYQGSHRWIDILPHILESYNAGYHETIKMSPNEVNNGNSHIVHKNVFKKIHKKTPKLKIGDIVRVSIKLDDRAKKYEGTHTLAVYRVIKIKYNINGQYPLYKIVEAFTNKPFPGWLYYNQLLKVDKATFASSKTLYDIQVLETKGDKSLIQYVGYDDKPQWVKTNSLVTKI